VIAVSEEVLDFTSYTAVCGDYSVHILEAIERAEKGRRIRIVVPATDAEDVRSVLESLAQDGVVSLASEECSGDKCVFVVEKR
jgi:TusA-related sulfurtransferase